MRELTLLGQNVNAWHGEGPDGRDWGLGRLLFRLAEIPGIDRLRYTTSHPRDMADDLIAAHRDLGELMPYLHLPVQSGSDRILAAMNRRHTAADYLRLVERIRAARPDIALASDFIVGFPGETEADFADDARHPRRRRPRRRLFVQVQPAPRHAGGDRRRPGARGGQERAPAAPAGAASPPGRRRSSPRASASTADILFEHPGRHPGQIVGRSPWLQPIHVAGGAAS